MQFLKIEVTGVDLQKLLVRGTEFHGHLGPFLACGLRMGLLALRELNSTGHGDLEAVVETGTTPPLSCLIDGIQVATGCTLGKGNIRAIDRQRARARFSKDDQQIIIELRPELVARFSHGDPEALAREVMELSDEELFQWECR